MGLFDKIDDPFEEVYEKVVRPVAKRTYRKAIRPAYRRAVRPAGQTVLRALQEYDARVNKPMMFDAKILLDNPNMIVAGQGRWAEERRKRGVDASSGLDLLRKTTFNKDPETLEAIDTELSEMPWYSQVALGVVSDPLTWATIGWGGIAKAGAQQGLKGAARVALKEATYQTGVPEALRLTTLPYRAYKSRQAGQLADMLTRHEALMDISAGKASALSEAERAALADRSEKLKGLISLEVRAGLPDVGRVRREYQEMTKIQSRLLGADMDMADAYARRRGNATRVVGQVARPFEEFQNTVRHRIEQPGALEKLTNVPLVRQVRDLIDPSRTASLESSGLLRTNIEYAVTLNELRERDEMLRGYLNFKQRQARFTADPTTGEMGKVKVKTGAKVMLGPNGRPLFEDVMKYGPAKYDLTPDQMDVWTAFHTASKRRAEWAKEMLSREDDAIKAIKADPDTREWFDSLGQMDGDSLFVPRIPAFFAQEGAHATDFSVPFLRQVARRVPMLGEAFHAALATKDVKGFDVARPVRRAVGAKQATEHERFLDTMDQATRTVWNYNLGDVVHGYGTQLAQIVADDTIALPLLRRLGKTPNDIVGAEVLSAVDQATRRTDLAGKTRQFASALYAARGVSGRSIEAVRRMRAKATEQYPELEGELAHLENAMVNLQSKFDILPPQLRKAASTAKRATMGAWEFMDRKRREGMVTQKPPKKGFFMFASSNQDDLDFPGAVGKLESDEQKQFMDLSAAIDRDLARTRTTANTTTLGDWRDGAENAMMKVSRVYSDDEARYVAALHGIAGEQFSVLAIRPDRKGNDILVRFKTAAKTPEEWERVRSVLDRHDINYRTLAPADDGAEVWIYVDPKETPNADAAIRAATKELGVKYTRNRVSNVFSVPDFATRDEAVRFYRDVVKDVEGSAMRGRGKTGFILTDPDLRQRLGIGQTPFRPDEEELLSKAAKSGYTAQDSEAMLEEYLLARRELDDAARSVIDSSDQFLGEARMGLSAAQNAKKDALRAKTMHRMRQVMNVPGLTGRYFDKKTAAEIEKLFGVHPQGDGPALLAATQAVAQSVQAGLDFSFAFLQSLAVLPSNPVGWAKALAYSVGSWASPNMYWRYMESLSNAADPVSGKSWLQTMEEASLSMSSTEIFAPSEAIHAMHVSNKPVSAVASFVDNLPWNRGFAMGRNVAAAELFRAQVGLEQALLGRALDTEELKGVGRQVDLATGVADYERLGIGRGQQTAERLVGRFGVQWFRSQTGRLVQAFNAGQIDGRVARRLLFHQLAAMSALYVAAAKINNSDPDFNPTSPHFLEINANGVWIGFGGIYPSMMKAVAQTVEAVASGDEERLTQIRNGRNPLLNFWRNGAPIVGQLIADGVFQVNADTRYGPVTNQPGELVTPFSIQALQEQLQAPGANLETVATGTAASALGLRADPITPNDYWRDLSDKAARQLGYESWPQVPKAAQVKAIQSDPILAEAETQKNQYFERKGDPVEAAFRGRDQSHNFTSDLLTASWAQVQAGTLDKAEWRRRYSEMSAKHAYYMDNLFSAEEVQSKLKGRKDPAAVEDRYAELYQGIQPENFDADQDGFITEKEWDAWRTAKRAFWVKYPEARAHREYILFDYPTRVWKDPVMADADRERRTAQDKYDEFLQIPKYTGLSHEQSQFIDEARSMANRARDEIGFAIAQQYGLEAAAKIDIPKKVAWQYAIEQMAAAGAIRQDQTPLLKVAIALDKPKVRAKLRNMARIEYLLRNRDMIDWYPSSIDDAQLRDDEVAVLGLLGAPMGESLQERLQNAPGMVARRY